MKINYKMCLACSILLLASGNIAVNATSPADAAPIETPITAPDTAKSVATSAKELADSASVVSGVQDKKLILELVKMVEKFVTSTLSLHAQFALPGVVAVKKAMNDLAKMGFVFVMLPNGEFIATTKKKLDESLALAKNEYAERSSTPPSIVEAQFLAKIGR